VEFSQRDSDKNEPVLELDAGANSFRGGGGIAGLKTGRYMDGNGRLRARVVRYVENVKEIRVG
jgi:hypothetical protein